MAFRNANLIDGVKYNLTLVSIAFRLNGFSELCDGQEGLRSDGAVSIAFRLNGFSEQCERAGRPFDPIRESQLPFG